MLKTSFVGFAKDAEFGPKVETQHAKKTEQDTLSEHMQMLYAKYNSAEFPLKDGNTVRSFKAHLGMSNLVKILRHFLTGDFKSRRVQQFCSGSVQ